MIILRSFVAFLGVLCGAWVDGGEEEGDNQTFAIWSEDLSTIPPIDPIKVDKLKDRMIAESHRRESEGTKYYDLKTKYADPMAEFLRPGIEWTTLDPHRTTKKQELWKMDLLDTQDELYDVVRYNSMVEDYKGRKHLEEKPHQTPAPVNKVFEDPFIDGIHSRGNCPMELKGVPEDAGENTLEVVRRYGKVIGITNLSNVLSAQRINRWEPNTVPRNIIGESPHWFQLFEWTRKSREHRAQLVPGEPNITVAEYVPTDLMAEARRLGGHYGHSVVYSRQGVLNIVPPGGGKVFRVTNASTLQAIANDRFRDREFEKRVIIPKWSTHQPPPNDANRTTQR